MEDGGLATGELSARVSLGPVTFSLEHREYLAYLNDDETAPDDPVARRSRLNAAGHFQVLSGFALPVSFSGAYDQHDSGEQALDFAFSSGLDLPGLRFAAELELGNSFGAEAEPTQNLEGSLSIGFDWLGGRHSGRLDYGVVPRGEIAELALSSQLPIAAGLKAAVDLIHDPTDQLSEARIGLDQRQGPFVLSTEFSTKSDGAYALGFSFTVDLAPIAPAPELRLSTLLANLRENVRREVVSDSFGLLSLGEGPD
ncbi:hypothetical protein [Pelagibius sp.]|uniref:hypothetical protein n=1 Tax=Pelagibius sp. TaxID=1931238 RepID=UPI002634BDC7|nr:hypothetical protein [Pelagibius sp.]